MFVVSKHRDQGRSDGGYIGIYSPSNQSTLQISYVVTGCFFLFDSGQIRHRASVRRVWND